LDRSRSLHLYRIIQEAVNNSVRHGKARKIHIEAKQDGKDVTITVLDDGSGLSERTTQNPGLGLRIMEYRARMLGATLTVERAGEAGGTRMICVCPLDPMRDSGQP
jgi:signal transduction histidine kinase